MRYIAVRSTTKVQKLKPLVERGQSMFAVLAPDGHYLGYVLAGDLEKYEPSKTAGDVLVGAIGAGYPRGVCARAWEPLDDALATMRHDNLPFLPVVDQHYLYIGTIDPSSIRFS